tara:strand:- start:79120 stop:79572 length:453 start_codon:yes stop_codon:yes gene_type:complete
MKTNTIVKIVAFVIMIIAAILQVIVMVKGDEAIEISTELQDSLINPYLYESYIVLFATAAIALILSVLGLFKDMKKAKNALIGAGALIGVFIIAYLLADGSDHGIYVVENEAATEETAKQVGTGLIAFYLLAGATVLSILYVEVTKIFNR